MVKKPDLNFGLHFEPLPVGGLHTLELMVFEVAQSAI